MRMSCNGCRVLRKGCSENCSIRPCLQWIKCPESQANATVFLAKFYGRAGLINLVNAGPENLRPAIFRSLLYEACGRIVNPIYGSVGLLWSGTWSLCHNAVEAVLNGAPITQMASDSAECNNGPPLKAYDIRHVSKEDNLSGPKDLHQVRTRSRFKKSTAKPKTSIRCDDSSNYELNRSTSHDSSLSHQSEAAETNVEGQGPDGGSLASSETAEDSNVRRSQPDSESVPEPNDSAVDGEVELELSLGLDPFSRSHYKDPKKKTMDQSCGSSVGSCRMELGFV